MRKRVLTRAVVALCAAAVSVGVAGVQASSAAPAAAFPIDNWNANVTTHVGALVNTDVQLDAGKFTGSLDTDTSRLTGSLALPPATFTYNALGLIGTTVTFNVDQTAGVAGTVDLAAGTVNVTDTFNVRLSSVKLFGIEVLDANTTCKTTTESVATLSGTLNLSATPATVHLSGNYPISGLDGCGFLGAFISFFTAGATNSLDVTITAP
jgi:hypothetical protein